MDLKISSGKWRPSCLGLNVSMQFLMVRLSIFLSKRLTGPGKSRISLIIAQRRKRFGKLVKEPRKWHTKCCIRSCTYCCVAPLGAKARTSILMTRARFLSVTRSKLRLCSASHRVGYFGNLHGLWLAEHNLSLFRARHRHGPRAQFQYEYRPSRYRYSLNRYKAALLPSYLYDGISHTFKSLYLYSWLRHQMETFSALLAICAGNSSVPGEFAAQRPETRSFDVFFDLRLNKRSSKQSWGWWFEKPSRPLWRHRNFETACRIIANSTLHVIWNFLNWCIVHSIAVFPNAVWWITLG